MCTYGLAPDPDAWAVSCFALRPRFRGRGLVHRLLEGVLADLARRGVRHVQGFPARRGHAWTGPEAVFVRAGFALESDGPRGPVYGKVLA